jgi:hypothetical protein
VNALPKPVSARYDERVLCSNGALFQFVPFAWIETIAPRPVLFIVGEIAHSKPFRPGGALDGAAAR